MGRISLAGILAHGRHGANPGERDRPQPFRVDIDIDVDLGAAAISDALADTIDYANIHARVVAIVERRSFLLLERLAGEIANEILTDRRVVRASVRVGKPELLDGATPSITIVREQK